MYTHLHAKFNLFLDRILSYYFNAKRPFVGNKYISTGTLIFPHKGDYPRYGMTLKQCFITERSSHYDHIKTGINATLNTTLMATNNTMTNSANHAHVAIYGESSNLIINNCKIRNYGIGIWAQKSNLSSLENQITNIDKGINLISCLNKNIYTNANKIDTFRSNGILQLECTPTLSTNHINDTLIINIKPNDPSIESSGIKITNNAIKTEANQAIIQNNYLNIESSNAEVKYYPYANCRNKGYLLKNIKWNYNSF